MHTGKMKNTSGDMHFSNTWQNFEGVEQKRLGRNCPERKKQNWPQNCAKVLNCETQKTYPGECKGKQLRRSRQA